MMTVIDFFVLMLHVQQVNGLCMIEQESTELLFSEIRFFERVCVYVCVCFIYCWLFARSCTVRSYARESEFGKQRANDAADDDGSSYSFR